MSKKTFTTAPKPKQLSADAIDAYVQGGAGHDTTVSAASADKSAPGPVKRLSLDLPEETHRRFKAACAAVGRKMAAELTDLIEQRLEQLEGEARR